MTDTTEKPDGRWLLIGSAATAFGISERTLYRQIASGQHRTKRVDRRVWVWLPNTAPMAVTDMSDNKAEMVSVNDDVSDTPNGTVSDVSVIADAMGGAVAALERALAEERERSRASELRASKAEQTATLYQERNRNLETEVQRLSTQLALPEPSPEPTSPPDPVEAFREEVGQLRARLEAPRASWWQFWRRG